MNRFALLLVMLAVFAQAADVTVIESVESPAQLPYAEDAVRVLAAQLEDTVPVVELPVEENRSLAVGDLRRVELIATNDSAGMAVPESFESVPQEAHDEFVRESANVTIVEEVVAPAQAPYVEDALDALVDDLAGDQSPVETAPQPEALPEEEVEAPLVMQNASEQLRLEENASDVVVLPVLNESESVIEVDVAAPLRNATFEVVPDENVTELVRENATLAFVEAGIVVRDATGKVVQATVQVTDPQSGELLVDSTKGVSGVIARVPQKPLAVHIALEDGPVRDILLSDALLNTSFIRVDDTPESAVQDRAFLQLYAIDPSSLSFAQAEVTVIAKGTSLYKCADWDFEARACSGRWTLFKSGLVPGDAYTFTMDAKDPAFGEINATAAIHIDEQQVFVSDVFAQVAQADGVWTAPIPVNHSVRVTFEQNLSDGNVIDFVARDNGTSAYVEVYVAGTSQLVGRSGVAGLAELQFITLEHVSSPTDVFDLRVVKLMQELVPCDGGDPDCNDAATIQNSLAAVLEFDFIHDQPILSTGADGLVAYEEATVNAPRYRQWNRTSTNFTLEQTNTVNPGGLADWIVLHGNHERDEFFMGVLDATTNVSIQRYDGTAWVNFTALTFDNPNTARRGFDLAIEDITGDMLVVYENSTAANNNVAFRVWNGSAYSTEATVNVGVSSAVHWVKTVARPGSDDIMLLVHDANNDLFGILWNGTGFVTASLQNITGTLTVIGEQVFDFVWEGLSGEGLVVYGNTTVAPGTFAFRTFNATAMTWSTDGVFFALNGGQPKEMRICSDPTSDYVGFISHDSTDDANALIWNGTAVETTPTPPAEDGAAEGTGVGANNVDCAFEAQSGLALFTYVQGGAAVDDAPTYCTYNKTAWSNLTMATCPLGPDLSTAGTSLESHELFRNPVTNELMVLGFNVDEDLAVSRWTGSAWANTTDVELALDCANGQTQCAMFDWTRFDPVPNITIIVPLNDTNFSVGSVVNITVNSSDNLNVSTVNLSVVLPNGTVREFNMTRVTGTNQSGTYEVNFTESQDKGRYNFTAQAKDASTHNNTNFTSGFFNVDFVSPLVFDVRPVQNTSYNVSTTIEIAANVTDNLAVDNVSANVTLPNSTVQQLNLTLAVGDKYNSSFFIPFLFGQYNVSFFANDSSNNVNSTESTFFVGVDAEPPDMFDFVPAQDIYTNVTGFYELAVNVTDDSGVDIVEVNITYANGTNETVALASVGGDKYNTSFTLLPIEGVNRILYIANDTFGNVNATTTRLIAFDNSTPLVTVIYPLGQNISSSSVLGLILNISDTSPLDNVSAVITDPNGTVYQQGNFSLGLQSDDFTSDTSGTNWLPRDDSLAPGQNCTTDIAVSAPGKMFISINGTSVSSITHCGFNSFARVPGDFDMMIDFNVTRSQADTFFSFRSNSIDSLFADGRRVFIDWDNTTGSPRYVFGYSNELGTTQTVVTVVDAFGRFRIVRSNTTFNNENRFSLQYYNFTNASWVDPLGSFTLNTTRAQVIQLKATSTAANYGEITVEVDSVSVVSDGTYIASFNETTVVGLHNVTFFVNDTVGFVNDTENTTFNVIPANTPPSRPFIVEPDPGDAVRGLFNITWAQVFDPEGDDLFFNITLLNPVFSFNATIVSDLPDVPSPLTFYQWNTSLYPDGLYSLRIDVFQNVSGNPINNNSDTLAGTFWVDNSVPFVTPVLPLNASTFNQGATFEIAANITDLTAATAFARIDYPNGTIVNLSLNESAPDYFNASFTAPFVLGAYLITYNATDLAGNTNDTEQRSFTVVDTQGPIVLVLSPGANASFLMNESVNITVNATDDSPVDAVAFEVTYPDGTVQNFSTNVSGSLYNLSFSNLTQRGNYSVKVFANDTIGNVNSTVFVEFRRAAYNVIDIVDTLGSFVPYTLVVDANSSGMLDLRVNFTGRVREINLSLHNESSPYSILRLDDEQLLSQTPLRSFAFYAIDMSLINFTNATALVTAVGDSLLYTCKDYNFSDRECFGNWTEVQGVTPGANYTIFLTPGDPAFLETSAAVDVALAPINDTAFVIGFVENSTSSVGFRVMNTNGSLIVGTVTVDATADGASRVDVAMLNSSHFSIAWVDGPEDDVTMQIFLVNGTNITSPTDVDTAVGLNTDVALAEVNGRFVVCYANDADGDADFQTFFNNGTLAVGELNVDGAINPSATLQNLVDCTGVNSTRWNYFWFDDGDNDATFSIQNETGGVQVGPTDVDTDVGETGQVATSTIMNGTFGLVWYDSTDQDVTIEFRDAAGGVVFGATDIDTAAGAVSRVAAGTVQRNESTTETVFVAAWWDNASNDLKAAVYLADGTELTAPFTVETQPNQTFRLIDVEGYVPITDTGICPGRFLVAYTNASGTGIFKGFFTNGSAWDGSCDLFAPLVFDVRPVAGSTFNFSDTIEIAANVTDDVAVDTVIADITFPNGTVQSLTLVLVPATNKYNASFTIPLTGFYNVSFFANDTSGRQNDTERTNFTAVFLSPAILASKVDSPDPVRKGTQLSYAITLNNSGSATAFNVTVVDSYPAGVVFHNSSPAPSAGNGTFSVGNITNGSVFVLNITVNVSSGLANGTVLNNSFNATFANNSGGNTTVQNSTLTTVFGFPVVLVQKSDSPDPVTNGSTLRYSVLINNTGDEIAYNVTLFDVYPVNVTFNGSQPAPSAGNDTFSLGNISAGGFFVLNITVNVSGNMTAGVLNNSVFVNSSDFFGQNSTANDSELTTVVTGGVNVSTLAILKLDSPDPVVRGSQLTYRIEINSTGNATAFNVTIVEGYPAGVVFHNASPAPTSGNDTFVLGNLTNGTSATINITVNVSSLLTNGTLLNNTVNASFQNEQLGTQVANASAQTTVRGLPVLFTNKSDIPDPVVRGGQLNYTITVNNTGDEVAYNVSVVESYPAGTVFHNASPAPVIGNSVFNLGNISANASVTLNMTVNVSAALANATVLNNSFVVSARALSGAFVNASNSTLTTVFGIPTLTIAKSDSPDPVLNGSTLSYTIVVSNTGDEIAYNVTLLEGYPDNVTFNGSQPAPSAGNNTFSVGNVSPGSAFTVNITVNVSSNMTSGLLQNNVSATFANLSGVNLTVNDTEFTTVVSFIAPAAGGGGGGGGGGTGQGGTYMMTTESWVSPPLARLDRVLFLPPQYEHTLTVLGVASKQVRLRISSPVQELTLDVGAVRDVDSDLDGRRDLRIEVGEVARGRAVLRLDAILVEPSVYFAVKPVVERPQPVVQDAPEEVEEDATEDEDQVAPKKPFAWPKVDLLAAFVFLAALGVLLLCVMSAVMIMGGKPGLVPPVALLPKVPQQESRHQKREANTYTMEGREFVHELKARDKVLFIINDVRTGLLVHEVGKRSFVQVGGAMVALSVGEEVRFDADRDGSSDIAVKLVSARAGTIVLRVRKLSLRGGLDG